MPRAAERAVNRKPSPRLSERSQRRPKAPLAIACLPRQICAFDIETDGTSIRQPEKATTTVAGIVVYTRYRRGYKRGPYQWFSAQNLAQLVQTLKAFDGPIVGLNLFDFDYRLLRSLFSMEGIVEKTIDLRAALLALDPDRRKHLSLERLAVANLGKSKLYTNKSIAALWRAGEIKKVLERNQSDCELAAELWQHLVFKREAVLDDRFHSDWSAFEFNPPVLGHVGVRLWRVLAGKSPLLTHHQWLDRLSNWGNALKPPQPKQLKIFVEQAGDADSQVFLRICCAGCARDFARVFALFGKQGNDGEKLPCPHCQNLVPALSGQVVVYRHDGSKRLCFLGVKHADHISAEQLPPPPLARRYIRDLRFWRY